MRMKPWGKEQPGARALGLLMVVVAAACGDSTGPPEPPEFFITTDSTSYTLKETSSGIFFIDFVTQFTNTLPDTVHFLSCLGTPLPLMERLSDGVFSPSEIGPGCFVAWVQETPLAPGAVTTDTLQWLLSDMGNNEENFNREMPGTFRIVLTVWDSLGEVPQSGREVAKELRVSAPFDILLAPGTGG